MAAQQNKPQEIVLNLKAEVQKLKEMRDALEALKQEGKLANTNENTYKALFNTASVEDINSVINIIAESLNLDNVFNTMSPEDKELMKNLIPLLQK